MIKKYVGRFRAMADENRLRILKMLIDGETCGCTMIGKLPISQPTLSYHLNILTQSGLATAYKEGTWRKHHVNLKAIDELIAYLTELRNATASCPNEK